MTSLQRRVSDVTTEVELSRSISDVLITQFGSEKRAAAFLRRAFLIEWMWMWIGAVYLIDLPSRPGPQQPFDIVAPSGFTILFLSYQMPLNTLS